MTTPSAKPHSRLIVLKPGMYLIRFERIPAANEATIIVRAPALQTEETGNADFFCSEHVNENTLQREDDVIVVRVSGGPVHLVATSLSRTEEFTPVSIDRIAGAAIRSAMRPQEKPPQESAVSSPKQAPETEIILLGGHIERTGDTLAPKNTWLGNPENDHRIEGIVVHWQKKPKDVDIAYSVRVQNLGPTTPTKSGGFAGTRHRSAGIEALTLSLVGEAADQYTLQGDAVFSDGIHYPIRNDNECTAKPPGQHLVALKLSVEKRD